MNTRRNTRLKQLLAFDATLLAELTPQSSLIGVDEVGRGSLIGPVVAAALVLPQHQHISALPELTWLDDSKAPHWTHDSRVAVSTCLKEIAWWGLGEATQEEVETLNVAQAALLAGQRAVLDLAERFPQCLLAHSLVVMDGKFLIPGLPCAQQAVIKADQLSAAVAGASVLAKAHRDTWVKAMALTYPGYDWENNAGYATPAHKAALATLGITPLHRKTFQSVSAMQLTLDAVLPV